MARIWQTYTFRYKPGDPGRAPRWVAPHQPRLDWQMWFAALGNYRENPWFSNFMVRLLTASPEVLRLLEKDPFAGRRPKYVRALAYEYRFSDSRRAGNPHKRGGAVSLRDRISLRQACASPDAIRVLDWAKSVEFLESEQDYTCKSN